MNDFAYAAPSTLHGQLQRGRGLGATRALGDPGAAADLVYACAVTDSHWDRQTEHRSGYLARLIHRLDLPLDPIERHVFDCAEDDADGIESPARGLARLPVAGATDALVHAWESTVHSYAREAILEGLRGFAPQPVADGFTEEGLDDCEPRVQEAACAHAPDAAAARARLAVLRVDPLSTVMDG